MEEVKFMRKIVSFVRREGRLTNGQKNALDEMWPKLGIDYDENSVLNFFDLFGNENPVTFEIGFGMGKSLIDMCKNDQNRNFIGTEVHRPGVGACLMAARNENISNIRVMDHDAVEILEKMIPNESLNRIQIFFPDPWHKKKHNKRRIIQPEFLKLLASKMKIGGILHMATDWVEYAEHMRDVGNNSEFFTNMSSTLDYVPRPETRPMTKFEERGIRLGHEIHDLMFVKK